MPTRVRARVKGVKGYINAMRPTWLSNPYSLDEYNDYSLEQCLIDYEDFLRCNLDMDESYAKRFDSIKQFDTIGCTCAGSSRCHVDIIIKVWNERNHEKKRESWINFKDVFHYPLKDEH